MVSINGINGINNVQQYKKPVQQISAIKPETQKELQALGINTQNIKTETQAQEVIKQFKELQQLQKQIQSTQNVQDIKVTQQVAKPEENQQTQAFAGSQAGVVQSQNEPFQVMNDILAQQNRLKLGLI